MALAHQSTEYAAVALLAFSRGQNEDDPELPLVGATLVAGFLDSVREMLKSLKG